MRRRERFLGVSNLRQFQELLEWTAHEVHRLHSIYRSDERSGTAHAQAGHDDARTAQLHR